MGEFLIIFHRRKEEENLLQNTHRTPKNKIENSIEYIGSSKLWGPKCKRSVHQKSKSMIYRTPVICTNVQGKYQRNTNVEIVKGNSQPLKG